MCRYHGGAAPQVMAAAKARLQALLFPTLDRLEMNLLDADGWVGTKAVDQVLRYTGIKDPEKPHLRTPVYDPAKFAALTDEELEQLHALLSKCVRDPDVGSDSGGDSKASA